MKIKKDVKMASEQAKYKKHCQFCGHTISFYAFEPEKKVCDWCGRLNYKNGLVEFKDKLEKERKRLKDASKDNRRRFSKRTNESDR